MSIEPVPEYDLVSVYRMEHRIRSLEAKLRLISGAAVALAAFVAVLSITGASAGLTVPDSLSAGQFHLVHDGVIVGRWVPAAAGSVRFEALGSHGSVVSSFEILPEAPFARVVAPGHVAKDGVYLEAASTAATGAEPKRENPTDAAAAYRRLS
jgi:hypothetical protein